LLDGEADEDVIYALSGRDGDDIIHSGGGTNLLFGGKGDDTFYISADAQLTSIVGDVETKIDGQYTNPTLNDNGLPDYDSAAGTTNESYADTVYIGWSYADSTITQNGSAYVIENEALGALVEVYDVEMLKFDNGNGTWDKRALTNGEPINLDVNYGDGSSVKFVLTDRPMDAAAIEAADTSSDWLQVYALVTKKVGRNTTTIEELVWEGARESVAKFNFSDGESINVINVRDADVFDKPILYTMGTDKVDLIFGNDSDNVIDGGGGDDIIFGGAGDDVIIGGDGDDVIAGGDGDDVLRGDSVDMDDFVIDLFEDVGLTTANISIQDGSETDGNDTIIGGDGIDDIDSGDGTNFVSSGRVDMDGDGNADLDLIKEHMTTNQGIFEDDDWI